MPPRIVTILGRLPQDLASLLTAEAITDACRREGYSWRERVLGPVKTLYLFILQVLHGNTACQHTVHFGGWSFSDSAYCAARKRLPLSVFRRLLGQIAETFRSSTEAASTWYGHRVWIIDGSSFSMPDTPELQAKFGQPSNQRRGCGSPVAKFVALFDLVTGMLLRVEEAPLRSHDMSRCAVATAGLRPSDIVLGDRGFCSYVYFAMLQIRGIHGVFRAHQRRIIDFTPAGARSVGGRSEGRYDDVPGRPGARWVLSQGDADQVVVLSKPGRKPAWISAQAFASLPEELVIRELRYKVHVPGYRVREVTLMTTLLDAATYPASALAELYYRRWQVELNFRHLKITMKMDVLNCKTVDGVLKELTVFALVYNLVRSVMVASAKVQKVAADRVSLVDAVRWLVGVEAGEDLSVILAVPARPGRVEPRVVKRRPKQYPRMTKPRAELRKELMEKELAA